MESFKNKPKYVSLFVQLLKHEVQRLKKEISDDYKILDERADFLPIFEWLIKNHTIFKDLSPDGPIRFEASDPEKYHYPFNVTTELTINAEGVVYIHFDINSKMNAKRNPSNLKKLPEVKKGQPLKIVGVGSQRRIRKTFWSEPIKCDFLVATSGESLSFLRNTYLRIDKKLLYVDLKKQKYFDITPKDLKTFDDEMKVNSSSKGPRELTLDELDYIGNVTSHRAPATQVCSVVGSTTKGEENVQFFKKEKTIYQMLRGLPFIMRMIYGSFYFDHHEKDKKIPKAIAYSAEADGDLFYLIAEIRRVKPDLCDVLWIIFSLSKTLFEMHERGILHRDIKIENILFFLMHINKNVRSIITFFNDFNLSCTIKESKQIGVAGSIAYTAFDSPCFNELLDAHNSALTELDDFGMPGFGLLPSSTQEEQVRYYYYQSFIGYSVTGEIDEESLSQQYMEWRCRKSIAELKKRYPNKENNENIERAVNIILATKIPIEFTLPNHPKKDVWSLCVVFDLLLDCFIAYQYPPSYAPDILITLKTFVSQTLAQQESARPDSKEFFNRIGPLLEKTLANYEKSTDKGEQKCAQKFYDQLSYFKVKWSPEEKAPQHKIVTGSKRPPHPKLFKPTPLKQKVHAPSSKRPTTAPRSLSH